jgi:stage V sporulation protein G
MSGEQPVREHGSQEHGGRAKLYADIAHPINSACREMIQNRVVEEYRKERELAQRPGYVSRYEDDYDDVFVGSDFEDVAGAPTDKPSKPRIDTPPSQTGPRPPHSPTGSEPSKQGPTPHSGSQTKRTGFGAGILDE